MNLEAIQPTVVTRVKTITELAAVQDIVIADDGTYPKTPTREAALQNHGLAVIVWQPESEALIDAVQSGMFRHEIYVPIVVEENVKVNTATGGTAISALKMVRLILQKISGYRVVNASPDVFMPMDPPFKNFGKVNGVNRIVCNLSYHTTIKPA